MNWDDYTQQEVNPILGIAERWLVAREAKDYGIADTLRDQLLDAGVLLATVRIEKGVPVLAIGAMRESSAHRYARLHAREAA